MTGLLPDPGLQKRVGEHVAKAAAQAHHHEAQTNNIAARFGASVAMGPIKTTKRAMEKVVHEYEGDHTKLKDVIRSTVIATDQKHLDEIVGGMKKEKNLHRYKEQHTEMGYKGHLFNYKYPNGVVGEIQANVRHMIYAKEKEKDARAKLREPLYSKLSAKIKLPPGMGHHHYEQWRKPGATPEEKNKAIEDARNYYKEVERNWLAKK